MYRRKILSARFDLLQIHSNICLLTFLSPIIFFFWIFGFFGFFGFYFDFDHGTIIAVALGTRDPIVVTRLLTGEAVGER